MNSLLSKEYVVLYLKSPGFKLLLDKIVKFTAQPAFNMSAFKQLLFAVPPYSEQKRIVERVNELMSLCNALEEKLNKKEATAERLVGAVVNEVTNNTNNTKDDKKKIINDHITKHSKALEKLS